MTLRVWASCCLFTILPHKTKSALEYAIVELKPPNMYFTMRKQAQGRSTLDRIQSTRVTGEQLSTK